MPGHRRFDYLCRDCDLQFEEARSFLDAKTMGERRAIIEEPAACPDADCGGVADNVFHPTKFVFAPSHWGKTTTEMIYDQTGVETEREAAHIDGLERSGVLASSDAWRDERPDAPEDGVDAEWLQSEINAFNDGHVFGQEGTRDLEVADAYV